MLKATGGDEVRLRAGCGSHQAPEATMLGREKPVQRDLAFGKPGGAHGSMHRGAHIRARQRTRELRGQPLAGGVDA